MAPCILVATYELLQDDPEEHFALILRVRVSCE